MRRFRCGVAFELFLKYHGLNHPPPEMKDRTWYNLPLVSAGLPTQAVTYKVTVFCLTKLITTINKPLHLLIICAQNQSEVVAAVKEELGLYTSNQVHAFRKSSPQILAAAGASPQGMQARVHAFIR